VRIASLLVWAICALACARTGLDDAGDGGARDDADVAPDACAAGLTYAGAACTCLAQVMAVYDTTPLARRVDGAVWVAVDRAHFTEILGPRGRFHATDLAASGSTAYGTAIGCAIEDGAVWCFPLAGPLLDSTDLGAGLGPGVMTTGAVQVRDAAGAPLAGARQLAATMNGGGAAFCAVTDGGAIWCWGYGVSGILGRGDTMDANVARPVITDPTGSAFADAAEVRLGFASACARKNDGSVWCWGDDMLGETGLDTFLPATMTPFPAGPLPLAEPAVRLAADPGNTHCAILASGRVECWGSNASQQAGAGAGDPAMTPNFVRGQDARFPITGVVDLAPDRGMQAMCATSSAGALTCWGHPFPPAGAAETTTSVPIAIPLAGGPLRLPLASYGGRDGTLVYVDPNGKLTFAAGGLPFVAQPPCD
jgi:hypothetical protein